MCECRGYLFILLLEDNTKSNKQPMSLSKHSLDSREDSINIFSDWLGLVATSLTLSLF